MDVHPYYGPGNIVIDTCSRCDVIWLDFGELRQVTDAPGKDRGKRFEIGEPAEDVRLRPTPVKTSGGGPVLQLLEDLLS